LSAARKSVLDTRFVGVRLGRQYRKRDSSIEDLVKTNDLLKQIDIPRHKLYYLEQKGYVTPARIPMGDLEAREFSESDVRLVTVIWKYLKKGYKHKVAYQKALAEMGDKESDAGHQKLREVA
jgi:DNA-binding transcriptional MerR regulator